MQQHEFNRRDLLRFCTMTAASLGLPAADVVKVVEALESKPRLPVIWLHGLECTCCSESFIRSSHPIAADIVLNLISLDYDDTIQAAAGHQVEEIQECIMREYPGNYVLAVEGNAPTADGGIYCSVAGRTFLDILKETVEKAKAVIAWGSCASNGCVQAARPNPTGAKPVRELIKHKPVINVSGCPPIAEVMTGVLTYILTFDRLPELDRHGWPKMFYGQRIHDKCYRRAFFDAGQFVESWDDEGARKGWCLYKMGCRGPMTYNSCSTFKWNNGVSFPSGSGHGCLGCSEANFWDNGPFYQRLTAVPLPGVEANADQEGKTLAVAAGLVWPPTLPPLQRSGWLLPVESARRPKKSPERGRTMSHHRIVVDPVTRIEGHLRIEAVLGDDGKVKEALSSGTMWRGLELILQGREPRDAWAFCERICGVCTTVHTLASVRAVENALGIVVPPNAKIIRNIMELTQYVQDHVIHFYHLHALDWVDVISAPQADPKATAELAQKLSPHWPYASAGYFTDVATTLKRFVESGQLGIFQNAYWGHLAYKLPPEANLMAVAHYLEALRWQKEIVKIHTIFGGKNSHPNYLVGGMACTIDLASDNAINIERLNLAKGKIECRFLLP